MEVFDNEMKVRINGELKDIHGTLKLSELLNSLNLKSNGIAVELNKEVVSKEKWEHLALSEGDTIEIVHFVGGGSN